MLEGVPILEKLVAMLVTMKGDVVKMRTTLLKKFER